MPDPAIRKLSSGFHSILRAVGLIQLVFGLSGLYFALASEAVNGLEAATFFILAVGGATLALGRRGVIVDTTAGTLTHWWGLAVPFARTVHPLAAIMHVRLLKQIIQTGKGARVLFPIMLKRKDIGDVKLWETSNNYDKARQQAEALAKMLGVDLHDESAGEAAIREGRFLDESLSQRYRRLGIPAPYPPPPPGAVARLRYGGARGTTVIEMPASGFRGAYLAAILAVLGFVLLVPVGVAVVELPSGQPPVATIILSILFGGLLGPMVLIFVLDMSTLHETITVSPDGIEIELRSWTRRSRTRLAAAEIEEILAPADLRRNSQSAGQISRVIAFWAGARAVLIRTDKGSTGAGRWVSAAEQDWLRDILVHGLVGGAFAPGASRPAPAPQPLPAVGPASADAPGSGVKWIAGFFVAAVLLATAYQSGLLQKAADRVRPKDAALSPRAALAGYELTPGPGSGYIQMYGRGIHAGASGPDLRISIEEVRLVATHRQSTTKFQDLALSLHRRIEGNWQLVGVATRKDVQSGLEAGGTFTYPGSQEFVIEGAADTCTRDPCHFRLHVLGQVASGRPGWDVTDMALLKIR